MASTTTTRKPAAAKTETTADALGGALARRDACAHALAAAEQRHVDLTQRLAAGDDAVSAAELTVAIAETDRARLLLSHAQGAHAEADRAHRIHVATSTAQRLTEGKTVDALDAKVDATAVAIRAALAGLRAVVDERNASVNAAAEAAQAAGLVSGECDPLSPIFVKPASWSGPRSLVVNGNAVPIVDAAVLVARAVERAQA